jgi:hypothetical protein
MALLKPIRAAGAHRSAKLYVAVTRYYGLLFSLLPAAIMALPNSLLKVIGAVESCPS